MLYNWRTPADFNIPGGYGYEAVALSQADANAAAADYTVADLLNLVAAAQAERPAVSATSIGLATSNQN